jgi:hypothetical protein
MEETPTSGQSFVFPSNPGSQVKRFQKFQHLSFGTPEHQPSLSVPKFENIMKEILHKINFFNKDDIIPCYKPEKLQKNDKTIKKNRNDSFEPPERLEKYEPGESLEKSNKKSLKNFQEHPGKIVKSSKSSSDLAKSPISKPQLKSNPRLPKSKKS